MIMELDDFSKLIYDNNPEWVSSSISEVEYTMKLRHLSKMNSVFELQYELQFPIPAFTHKVKYYMRVIDNAVMSSLNDSYHYKGEVDDIYLIAHYLKENRDRVIFGLSKCKQYLDLYKELLDELKKDNINYQSNLRTQENVALAYYMFWSIIYCEMEIQNLFHDDINPDDRKTIEEIFMHYLNMMPPKEVLVKEVDNSKPIEEETLEEKISKESELVKHFFDVMEIASFFKTPKVAILSDNAKVELIRKLVHNGIPYMVAMIRELGYPQIYYKVICKEEITRLSEKLRQAIRAKNHYTIFHNFNSFKSETDKLKYNAWTKEDEVKNDYKNLLLIK